MGGQTTRGPRKVPEAQRSYGAWGGPKNWGVGQREAGARSGAAAQVRRGSEGGLGAGGQGQPPGSTGLGSQGAGSATGSPAALQGHPAPHQGKPLPSLSHPGLPEAEADRSTWLDADLEAPSLPLRCHGPSLGLRIFWKHHTHLPSATLGQDPPGP